MRRTDDAARLSMRLAETGTVKPLKMNTNMFKSFILGGFECSTHRRRDGTRLDLIHSTRHDVFARSDYELLQRHGIAAARDGFRWHLIEATSGTYDFSSAIPMLEAARATTMQVIWDLWHYGWPDHLDIFSAALSITSRRSRERRRSTSATTTRGRSFRRSTRSRSSRGRAQRRASLTRSRSTAATR